MSKWVDEAMRLSYCLGCAADMAGPEEREEYETALRRHLTTQAEMCEKLAEALTLLIDDQGPDFIKSSSWEKARGAMAAYRESQQ